jgi:GTPase SAR1 family protein
MRHLNLGLFVVLQNRFPKGESVQYSTRQVFTPTTPARIAFVDRSEINDRLVNALATPGKQIVVYGHSGTGKTTLLLNKLHQTYETHITTRCMKGMKFEQLILDGFDQLEPFYTAEITSKKTSSRSVDFSANYALIRARINASSSDDAAQKQARILPPQLTPQALGKFIGAAKACWVLEDFHKIEESEKQKLSQLMKVFMDLSDEYPDVKIIAVGAVDTARQVVEYDLEMRHRVAEISVPLMTSREIKEIIKKGEQALNIRIAPEIADLVARHSNGLASVCHHLCLNMCDAANIQSEVSGPPYQMSSDDFQSAIKIYVDEASDTIKSAFGKALKPRRRGENNSEIIIQALSSFKEEGAARFDLLKKIHQERPSYPDHRLKSNLKNLCGPSYGQILRYDSNSSLFSFSDPIYRAYALAMYQKSKSRAGANQTLIEFEEILKTLIRAKLSIESLPQLRVTRSDNADKQT